jgi:lysyl-tRNA synthetase class 2
MRPEKVVTFKLNENEQLIFDVMQTEKSMELNSLKAKANLSNKQWDLSIKNLTKNNLLKVSKVDEVLTVDLV